MQNVLENKHDIFNDIFMIFSIQILICVHFLLLECFVNTYRTEIILILKRLS